MIPDRLAAALAARYRIVREVGAGGMAAVYLAEDLKHHRRVALKVLHPELAHAIGPDRFLREIETTAALHHPHVLPLYDSGEADGLLFYVMPYVEGESLRDRLTRERQLSVGEALHIAREVADALGYAHAHGVIHRDVKPENILLESGHAIVADFGIAKAVTAASRARLTQTGVAVGTPHYMSPEQATGDAAIDGRSDLYALGCVLYEMLAGQAPFTGPTVESIVHQHLTAEPRPVNGIRPAVPVGVADLVMQLLAKTPADRPATGAAVGRAIEQTLPTPRTATGAAGPRPRRVSWILTALGAGLALGGFVLLHAGRGPSGTRPGPVVLPFEHLGADADEFFTEGMTDEVTSRLAEISGLRVIPRMTARQYKGTNRSLGDIGAELQVAYILSGTVRTDRTGGTGGQVRVVPQLVRARDRVILWTGRYSASLAPGEVFRLQSRIAEQVATALNVKLLGAEQEAVRRSPTMDREAHDAYLQGRFHWNRRSQADLERAVGYFTAATERDSQFALAWAGLADTYALLPLYGVTLVPRPEAYRRAEDAARRATALDPTLAEAHVSLAYARMYGDWDWAGAERGFLRAIALDSTYPVAHYWYTELLLALGRDSEAVGEAERAVAFAPADAMAQHLLGWSLALAGHPDSGLVLTRRALELEPSLEFANVPLGFTALVQGRYDEAVEYLERSSAYRPYARAMAEARRDAGNRPAAIRAVSTAARTMADSLDPAFASIAFGTVGAMDSALAWYRRAFRERTEGLVYLRWDQPWIPEVVDDPRFVAIRRRAGLPE
jgi:eukaryotic-like serine/threonine-protein kinase